MAQQLVLYRPPREALNNSARIYDESFERLPATRRIRRIVWSIFHKYFRPVEHLLELNCGTGTDAMELASSGIYVLATDASSDMISLVRSKIASTALYSFISPMQLSFQRLHVLSGERFDGAYSNFGGLNCTRNLKQVAFDLANLVKPSKYVVLCLMPDFCLWETTTFLLRGKFRQAFRRRQPDGVLAAVNGDRVWVHYYSPKAVRKAFAPYFDFVELKGLNVFAPPPAARRSNEFLGKAVRLLEFLDDSLPKNSRINGWGDHYVIVFRRKS